MILINLSKQSLLHLTATTRKVYAISSSRFGEGEQEGSHQTPRGWHEIAQKIGDDAPLGQIFKGRKPVSLPFLDPQQDYVCTRILWLSGLEKRNTMPGQNSQARYIYIHGTHDEEHIGQKASIGCIRMRNHDIIEMYTHAYVGERVLLYPEDKTYE